MSKLSKDPMLEMFIFETAQLLEQLEQVIISSEKANDYSSHSINEIFRIMHTIKGSAAMMLYNNVSLLAHTMEDLFYCIRENKPTSINFSQLTDLILNGADFIKTELAKIKEGKESDGESGKLIDIIKKFLSDLKDKNPVTDKNCEKRGKEQAKDKQKYYISSGDTSEAPRKNSIKATVFFDDDCKMENVRAFAIVHNLKDIATVISYTPEDIIENDDTEQIIRKQGFCVYFKTEYSIKTIREILMQTAFLRNLQLEETNIEDEIIHIEKKKRIKEKAEVFTPSWTCNHQNNLIDNQ